MSGPNTCCTPAASHSGSPRQRSEVTTPGLQATSKDGMIDLPGGRFLMGTGYEYGFPDDGEGPVRPVTVSAFSIDITPVTNQQFSAFIRETGYVTESEQFGWSFVFWAHIPEDRFQELVDRRLPGASWWCKVNGATWKSPEGPGSTIETRSDHPAVHVSFNDAAAYSVWAGKRLPTEAEWEYAARGGLVQKLYPWGDELTPDNKHLCNIWQGKFPMKDTAEDGFAGTCPVCAFPPNAFGLYSVTGNVWEWTSDWFQTQHLRHETTDPRGPDDGTDKVLKGGSFLCHASYCNRYRVAARTHNTPDSSTSNLGFRCVRSALPDDSSNRDEGPVTSA